MDIHPQIRFLSEQMVNFIIKTTQTHFLKSTYIAINYPISLSSC